MNRKQKKILLRILLAAVMLVIVWLLPIDGWLQFALFMLPYLCIGYDILIKAVKGIVSLQPFDENFLMALATVGAIALGNYTEGVAVMLFYQIGELFQSVAVGKSRRSIGALMDIRPDSANLERESSEIEVVAPEDVPTGSILVVRPGEKISIDGIVITGTSSLNTVSLTGESRPRDVGVGDTVISGCINETGVLRIRTTKPFGESTVSKILDLVENASAKKSRSENFIAKFARIYTPVVCLSALVLAILPPLVLACLHLPFAWSDWFYRALTFLVISCPCALVISIPLTFFAGLGGASREGILVKGSNYIETLAHVGVVAFDKTGTMTHGSFEVARVYTDRIDEEELLEYAALAEIYSTHPIGESIRNGVKKAPDVTRVSDVTEVSGHGVKARVGNVWVAVGNAGFMTELGAVFEEPQAVGTIVHVALDGVWRGAILLADRVKESAAEAVRDLSSVGVRRTVMLTGDARSVGEAVADELGIDEVACELLPQDKLHAVERMIAEKRPKEQVAFVGDGINDAPVLSRADIGIAMGALGADAAIEAADVVLMDDDPRRIAKAIRLSRGYMRIVHQNIWFALGVKLVCLVLGALGIANMWLAIFADVGVMVLAVLNAVRALYIK